MAAVAGKVKSVTSDVIAIDKNDRVRVLNVDDEVYIGESIKGESQSASVTITAVDGSDISLNGYDTIWLDSSVVSADTSAENSIDTDALFIAVDGEHRAFVEGDGMIRLQMKDVDEVEVHKEYVFLNTGSPHHVQWVPEVATVDVKKEGAALRYGALYVNKGGSNINFVSEDATGFKVRTYERGVEDETYSCGTGVTAVALALYHTGKTLERDITLHTQGGDLQVSFDRVGERYENIYLKGGAEKVFEGEIAW